MLPAGMASGINLLPGAAVGMLVVLKIAAYDGNIYRMIASALNIRRLGWLAAFLMYGVLTAFVLPKLFYSRIEVFPMSGLLAGTSSLHSSSSNLAQSCYMTLSVLLAMSISVIGSKEEFRYRFAVGIMLNGIALILTGVIDLGLYQAGLSTILDPFRNVTYTLLTNVEQLGAKRIVGLMPEASSYGTSCVSTLSLLAFLRPCLSSIHRRRTVPLLIVVLLFMAISSTASSAYVGLAIFFITFAIDVSVRVGSRSDPVSDEARCEMLALAISLLVIVLILCVSSDTRNYCYAMIDEAILEKSNSASFLERGAWTSTGLHSLVDTFGLGVGLGSVRVSNWFVSILASTGVVGSVLMFLAIASAMFPNKVKRGSAEWMWQRALKLSLIPAFGMNFVIGTTPDLGVTNGIIIGLIAACRVPGGYEKSSIAANAE